MTKGLRRAPLRGVLLAAGVTLAQSCDCLGSPHERRPAGALLEVSCDVDVQAPAKCARLLVFENRDTRTGRLIPLRIIVLRATGPERLPDPVFHLAGGPGQAATTLIRATRVLGEKRDLVFADQRGTGGSNGLLCTFYGPPDDPQSYFDLFLPPAKVEACRKQLEEIADLSQYTTSRSVDDLEEIRAALGYERINLVGGSYGTRLALEYLRRYEQRVRTVVLNGAVPPSKHVPESFGRLAQRALDGVLDECARDRDCGAAFPGIQDKARDVFRKLSQSPARAQVAHPASGRRAEVVLTREHVGEAIRYMTYSSRDASRVPLYLFEAYHGNYSPIAEFLLRWRADGKFDGLYLSITCAEDVPFVSPGAERDDEPTYLGSYRIREQRAACGQWRRGGKAENSGTDVSSKVPVLIFSGALDPVTPPADGDAVARTLPSSLHVTIPFGGHAWAGLRGVECVHNLRDTFIERGTVGGLDPSCVSGISRGGFVLAR